MHDLAPWPLYNTFVERSDAVKIFRRVFETQAEEAARQRKLVS